MINPLSTASHDDVLSAIRQASAETGSNFDYLVNTAMRESSLQCDAKSKTSSACGLFQFVDQTWLGLMKRHGAEHGLSGLSDAISQDSSGHYSVASGDTKQAILALRQDPKVSSLMAGEAANESQDQLTTAFGHKASSGDLYLAHFLGTGGAKKLIAAKQTDPSAQADQLFPQAASANRTLFYHTDGTPKTVSEIYHWATQPSTSVTVANTDLSNTVIAKTGSASTPQTANTATSASDFVTQDFSSNFLPRSYFPSTWSPNQALSSLDTNAPPSSNLMLTPGVLNVLETTSTTPQHTPNHGRRG